MAQILQCISSVISYRVCHFQPTEGRAGIQNEWIPALNNLWIFHRKLRTVLTT